MKTNASSNKSGMSEIRELTEICELTDDELDAVNGGKDAIGTLFTSIFGGLLIGTLIGKAIG